MGRKSKTWLFYHRDLYPNTTMKIDTVEPSSAITKYHFQYQWPVRNYYFFTKEIPTFTFIFNCSMGMGNHTMILISHASEWLLCTFCPSHEKKRISRWPDESSPQKLPKEMSWKRLPTTPLSKNNTITSQKACSKKFECRKVGATFFLASLLLELAFFSHSFQGLKSILEPFQSPLNHSGPAQSPPYRNWTAFSPPSGLNLDM